MFIINEIQAMRSCYVSDVRVRELVLLALFIVSYQCKKCTIFIPGIHDLILKLYNYSLCSNYDQQPLDNIIVQKLMPELPATE